MNIYLETNYIYIFSCHDITEILLKVALTTITLTLYIQFPDTYASISSDNCKGDFLAVFYRNPTLDKQLTDVFKTKWKESDETTFELELFGLPYEEFSKLSNNQQKKFFDYMRSDHAVFWEHDIPAILLTDTGKTNYQCAHVNLHFHAVL